MKVHHPNPIELPLPRRALGALVAGIAIVAIVVSFAVVSGRSGDDSTAVASGAAMPNPAVERDAAIAASSTGVAVLVPAAGAEPNVIYLVGSEGQAEQLARTLNSAEAPHVAGGVAIATFEVVVAATPEQRAEILAAQEAANRFRATNGLPPITVIEHS